MKRFATSLALAAAMLFISTASHAVRYTFKLSGANENPPTASAGTGAGVADLDTTTHTLALNLAFSGITTPATAAHIHCCAVPPGNAGVATPVPAFPLFPLGVTNGSYNQILDLTLASSWNPAFITANGGTPASAEAVLAAGAAAGQAYFNIHTSTNPGGEVRGFLTLQSASLVPSLSEWALVVLAAMLAIMGFVTMRKRMR